MRLQQVSTEVLSVRVILNLDRNPGYSPKINNISSTRYSDMWCNPNFYLSLSYNFNSTRSKYKGEQASDELNRL
ncbi:MAG: hypothetical protein FWD66_03690 [Paludibacter sp.]|nr:hypothetical protein [Paludibacter sp.]